MTVIQKILDTLNLVKDDGKVIDASKYFLSKRVLEIAYARIHKENLDSSAIAPYITALLDYRADKAEIDIIKDEQTDEYHVYWQKVGKGTPNESQATSTKADGSKKEDQ